MLSAHFSMQENLFIHVYELCDAAYRSRRTDFEARSQHLRCRASNVVGYTRLACPRL